MRGTPEKRALNNMLSQLKSEQSRNESELARCILRRDLLGMQIASLQWKVEQGP